MDLSRRTVLYVGYFEILGKKVHVRMLPTVETIGQGCEEYTRNPEHDGIELQLKNDHREFIVEVEPPILESEVAEFNKSMKVLADVNEPRGYFHVQWAEGAETWHTSLAETRAICEFFATTEFPAGGSFYYRTWQIPEEWKPITISK